MKQNYFQYNGKIFQPQKCIARGSPISDTMTEIYPQYLGATYIKHWLRNKKQYITNIC